MTTMPEVTTEELIPAPLWRNVLAMVYDLFLILPLLMANAFIWVMIYGPTASAQVATVPAWLLQSTSAAIVIGFYAAFWLKSGQTLGMQAWRIKLTDEDGRVVDFRTAITRACWATLSLTALGLGYWWALWDSDKSRWHDRLSNTRLIVVPKRDR